MPAKPFTYCRALRRGEGIASQEFGAVHAALAAIPAGASAKEVAKSFGRAIQTSVERIEEILETLAALGKARQLDDDRYIAV